MKLCSLFLWTSITLSLALSFPLVSTEYTCSYCDQTIVLSNSIFECFDSKTESYIEEAVSGPIIVNYSSCDDVSSNSDFHDPTPRLSTPLIENDCASTGCGESENDDAYYFFVSREQLFCLKKLYPIALKTKKSILKIDLNDCLESNRE